MTDDSRERQTKKTEQKLERDGDSQTRMVDNKQRWKRKKKTAIEKRRKSKRERWDEGKGERKRAGWSLSDVELSVREGARVARGGGSRLDEGVCRGEAKGREKERDLFSALSCWLYPRLGAIVIDWRCGSSPDPPSTPGYRDPLLIVCHARPRT